MEVEQERAIARSIVWFRKQNEVEQANQVNVVSIKDAKYSEIFQFPCQESPKHQRVASIDSKMCGKG